MPLIVTKNGQRYLDGVLLPPPEVVRPSIGVGSPTPLVPPTMDRSGLPPHPGPSGLAGPEALKRHATRALTLAVARSLLDGHLDMIARVLSLEPCDALHLLADVYDERYREFSPTPAPGG